MPQLRPYKWIYTIICLLFILSFSLFFFHQIFLPRILLLTRIRIFFSDLNDPVHFICHPPAKSYYGGLVDVYIAFTMMLTVQMNLDMPNPTKLGQAMKIYNLQFLRLKVICILDKSYYGGLVDVYNKFLL